MYSPVVDKTLECMCLVAFFGLLRCSEFTVRSVHSVTSFLKINDIVFASDNSMFTLLLRSSKTDPFRRGTKIQFFKNEHLCPVSSMYSFLRTVRCKSFLSNEPLFVDAHNQPFSRDLFISYLREVLNKLGYDENAFCGHSFRKGFASSMSSAGIKDNLIKSLGRWNSSCYSRYISVPASTLHEAQRKTISHNQKSEI